MPVMLLASDPYHYGGAWNADTCQKVVRFVDLAETFHLPVVYLMDCPGFLIGLEAEKTATIRHGVRAMAAMNQTTVPWCTIIVRNAFGVAGVAHQPGGRLSMRYAWLSAYWGSLPLEGGIEAAYRAEIEAGRRSQGQAAGDRARLNALRSPFRSRREVLGRGDHRSAQDAFAAVRLRDLFDGSAGLAHHRRAGFHLLDAGADQPLDLARGFGTALRQRMRTSPATTAKPRPCSPARAASTAALSARMLVWNAMPSMVPMISPMRADDARMSSIVCTTSRITGRHRRPLSALWRATRETPRRCVGGVFTVDEICSIDAADSSRLAAACSVRADRSIAPLAISLLECDDLVAGAAHAQHHRSAANPACGAAQHQLRRLVPAPGRSARW
jgi:hypothetical protein